MAARGWGVLLDLDQTLVLTSAIEHLRRQRAWSKVYRSFDKTSLPPGTARFVTRMGNLAKIGVVTTSPRPYAERLLAHHRIEIPVLVSYYDVRHRKPHPEPILKAARALGLNPTQCIHVGDQVSDIEAALRAQAIAVALSWDGALDKDSVQGKVAAFCQDWDRVYNVIAELVRG
ncbi:MAG: HAD-IA family hydrolase [Acidobacteria bacterium]|nr:HAD-IA family hydrolase [Acidobacteriota bacterium]